MTVIRVDDFGGMAPAIDPRSLPANGAADALNIDTTKRALVPLRGGRADSDDILEADLPEWPRVWNVPAGSVPRHGELRIGRWERAGERRRI